MTVSNNHLFGKNGPGDIETIISEIELETAGAKERRSRLKCGVINCRDGRLSPYQALKADLDQTDGVEPAAATDSNKQIKAKPDKD